MRIFLLAVLAVFTWSLSSAQSFEGKIAYRNTYKSKIVNLSDEKFSSMMGDAQMYYIKDGEYKSETNGSLMQWQLYINKDNKLYNKMSNSEALVWNDGATNSDEVLKAEVNKGAIEILGYKCDELILTCKSGMQKYYYTSKVPVDAKLYANHKFGNWYDFLSRSNALPLKMIIDTAQFTLESTATEVKPMKLEQSFFELPVGVKTIKSTY